MHDFKANRCPGFLIGTFKLVRLVNRHLKVLIAMKEQERRILGIHMNNWASKLC